MAKSLLGISYISYLAPYSRSVTWLPYPLEHRIGRSACRSPHGDYIRVAMGVTACHTLARETARMASATTRTLHNKYIIIVIKIARGPARERAWRARDQKYYTAGERW